MWPKYFCSQNAFCLFCFRPHMAVLMRYHLDLPAILSLYTLKIMSSKKINCTLSCCKDMIVSLRENMTALNCPLTKANKVRLLLETKKEVIDGKNRGPQSSCDKLIFTPMSCPLNHSRASQKASTPQRGLL